MIAVDSRGHPLLTAKLLSHAKFRGGQSCIHWSTSICFLIGAVGTTKYQLRIVNKPGVGALGLRTSFIDGGPEARVALSMSREPIGNLCLKETLTGFAQKGQAPGTGAAHGQDARLHSPILGATMHHCRVTSLPFSSSRRRLLSHTLLLGDRLADHRGSPQPSQTCSMSASITSRFCMPAPCWRCSRGSSRWAKIGFLPPHHHTPPAPRLGIGPKKKLCTGQRLVNIQAELYPRFSCKSFIFLSPAAARFGDTHRRTLCE